MLATSSDSSPSWLAHVVHHPRSLVVQQGLTTIAALGGIFTIASLSCLGYQYCLMKFRVIYPHGIENVRFWLLDPCNRQGLFLATIATAGITTFSLALLGGLSSLRLIYPSPFQET